MDKSRWIIFAVLCIAVLGGLVYLNRSESVDVSDVDGAAIITGDEPGQFADNVYGNPESDVVLIEYGDFQCPGCANAAGPLNQLKEDYKDDIAFVYRHFPLVSAHPNALAAAAVSEAAGRQGKFWDMLSILFDRQSQWGNTSAADRGGVFEGYARDLALDIDQFQADIGDSEVSAKINFQRTLGTEMGVDSTPTFYLNGEKLPRETLGDLTNSGGEQLRQKIDEALER